LRRRPSPAPRSPGNRRSQIGWPLGTFLGPEAPARPTTDAGSRGRRLRRYCPRGSRRRASGCDSDDQEIMVLACGKEEVEHGSLLDQFCRCRNPSPPREFPGFIQTPQKFLLPEPGQAVGGRDGDEVKRRAGRRKRYGLPHSHGARRVRIDAAENAGKWRRRVLATLDSSSSDGVSRLPRSWPRPRTMRRNSESRLSGWGPSGRRFKSCLPDSPEVRFGSGFLPWRAGSGRALICLRCLRTT
jgi:hypothetical protein